MNTTFFRRTSRTTARRTSRGFTLIETMAAVSIAGVLSTIALPSLEGQLQRVRRTDALVAAMLVQGAQERLRSNTASYGALADIGVAARSAGGHYALQIASADAAGFVLVVTATGAQARDAACRVMRLTADGLNVAHASGPDATVGNAADTNRKCWTL